MDRFSGFCVSLLVVLGVAAAAMAGEWDELTPAESPTARFGHTMTYDTDKDAVLLYDGGSGGSGDETWRWTGSTWTRLCTGCLGDTWRYAAMAYDRARERAVIFGGTIGGSFSDQTWEWNGLRWIQQTGTGLVLDAPGARANAAATYDASASRVILVGGKVGVSARHLRQ